MKIVCFGQKPVRSNISNAILTMKITNDKCRDVGNVGDNPCFLFILKIFSFVMLRIFEDIGDITCFWMPECFPSVILGRLGICG